MADEEGSERGIERRTRVQWATSNSIALVFFLLLLGLWINKSGEELTTNQLRNDTDVAEVLALPEFDYDGREERVEIKTGVFVQSLRFLSASDVHITGYIWQHWPDELKDRFQQDIVLPELVDSSVALRVDYEEPAGDGVTVIGWYFEGAFRQPFEYHDYPFDPKEVWIRVWPKSFAENLVLVPDFEAYPGGTDVGQPFGIDESIVLGDWERDDTYFDYESASYNTNFGIPQYVGQENFPELRFNVLLRRKLENAAIVSLAPLMVVAVLAFSAVLTVTRRSRRADRFGYNVSGIIGTVSALFFVVLLSHIQLRQDFAGAGVTYLEYFYFFMYLVLMAVATNAFVVSTRPARDDDDDDHHLGDNMLFKLAYWPTFFAISVLVTVVAF